MPTAYRPPRAPIAEAAAIAGSESSIADPINGGLHARSSSRAPIWLAILGITVLSKLAKADVYPARPVHMVIGLPPGSAPDVVARLIGQSLSEQDKQQFMIENRTGAATNLAAQTVVRAEPDRAIRCSRLPQRTRSTLRSTQISISTSAATSRRLPLLRLSPSF